jgi:GT2 family glycosyltransferase
MHSTIIIAQHGQAHLTIGCIESIRRYHGEQPEIILVDDGSSTRDVEQVARASLNNVAFLRQAHRGVTAAWNAGAAQATGEVLVFLNNDVTTFGAWVGRLTSLLDDERTVIAGVQRRRERHLDPELLSRLPSKIFAAGWCFAVRRRDFEAIRGFRGALRLYFSDTDLQSRLLVRGGRGSDGIATARLPLRHLGHATTAFCTTRKEQWQADRRRFRRFWSESMHAVHSTHSPSER